MAQTGAERSRYRAGVRLWLRLVGTFEATLENGSSVLPISKKARALLALLAAHMPQPVRRDFAASLLWSGKPKDHAANSLRQALRELQISLASCGDPPILITGGGRLMLQSEGVWIDIHDPAASTWKTQSAGTAGPPLLCQNLQGLDTAFDLHLERVWKNLVFQQAFAPVVAATDDLGAPVPAAEVQGAGSSGHDAVDEPPGPQKSEDSVHGQGWKIAVLPFRSLGAPLEGGLSLGLAEEISAAMARYRMPRLIATGSFWDGTGPVADSLARCRTYGLEYVIAGTIQVVGKRIRVTVTLLDVDLDFEVIWASRFEGTDDDLFTLQDTIASQTVAQIDPELLRRQQYHGEVSRTPDAVAHQSLLTAIQAIYRPDKVRFLAAKQLLTDAIRLDPEYAAPYAWLAYWNIMALGQGWSADPVEAGRSAGEAADRAVMLDPHDARGVSIAGHVKAYMHHEVEAALTLHQRAIALNPNLPIVWTVSACAHIYNGLHDVAVRQAETAIALSPSDPHVFFAEHVSMFAHMFLGNLEKADALASSVLAQKPGHLSALRVRIATLGLLHRPAIAAEYVSMLLRNDPNATVESIAARPPLRSHDLTTYKRGLRQAGVPD